MIHSRSNFSIEWSESLGTQNTVIQYLTNGRRTRESFRTHCKRTVIRRAFYMRGPAEGTGEERENTKSPFPGDMSHNTFYGGRLGPRTGPRDNFRYQIIGYYGPRGRVDLRGFKKPVKRRRRHAVVRTVLIIIILLRPHAFRKSDRITYVPRTSALYTSNCNFRLRSGNIIPHAGGSCVSV